MALNAPLTLAGNLVRDVELRRTKQNKPVVSFTLATTPSVFNQDTKKYEDGETLFMDCVVFNNDAEHLAASASKGTRLIVPGQVKARSWVDKENNTRTKIELIVDEVGLSMKFGPARSIKGDHSYTKQVAAQQDDGWVTVDDETPF